MLNRFLCSPQVLCCMSLLVNVLGADSSATYGLLLPLLQEALHPNSKQPELLEDALCLWLVALRNAPGGLGAAEAGGPAAALLQLAPALAACLTNSTGAMCSVLADVLVCLWMLV
jgi:hypothetical protein